MKKLKVKLTEKEKKQSEKTKRLYNTYGITLQEWEEMFKSQNNVCAVCKMLPGTGRLCVDHIHQKGYSKLSPIDRRKYIRGLVCFMCNTGFKAFEKTVNGKRNRQSLNGTYEYFQKWKLKGE